ncbi:MAG: helix-turn-helix transcriptional regulator [Cytophagales bacterium]|jgi:DNA-binding XRE family transcriptional regulator|nr:helix-turn-helix transcriptional regulator [Cytophagales bacterium]
MYYICNINSKQTDMDKILGNNIKALRIKLDLTQEMLADYLGISRGEMNYYENGTRPMPSNLVTKAAELFSVDEYDLYQENEALMTANVAFAFRAESISVEDLNEIAGFKKIAMNYLKMQSAFDNE